MSTKREHALLERAFEKEIASAFGAMPPVIQVRGKLVEKMAEDGLLRKRKYTLGGRFPVSIEGYELTELGRLTYCASCDEAEGEVRG